MSSEDYDNPVNAEDLRILECPEYHVVQWYRERDGRGKPEAIVIYFEIFKEDGVKIGLRLKSRRAVQELVDTLSRHMRQVWP